MAADPKAGDRVSWKSGASTAHGTVESVYTKPSRYAGRPVAASADDPRYLVKNDSTGKSVVKKGDALIAASASGKAPVSPRKRRVPWRAIAIGVAGVAVIAVGAFLLLGSGSDGLSRDDYVEDASPAFAKVQAEVDAAQATFPEAVTLGDPVKYYISKFRSRVRGFDRTVEAALAEEQKKLARAAEAIDSASSTLEAETPALTGEGDELADDADEAATAAREYTEANRAYLDDYGATIAYLEQRLPLDRKRIFDEDEDFGGGGLDAIAASVDADVKRQRRIIEQYGELVPPPGFEKLHGQLNDLAGLDLAAAEKFQTGLDNFDGTGVIVDFTGTEERDLRAYRLAEREISGVPLNAQSIAVDESAAAFEEQLAPQN